jgi:AraC family transcriptional regulator of adaptative response/methylated-DNA-[protein]-cysteine methyltransferase
MMELYKNESIETPLGKMIAIADTKNLYLLEFTDARGVDREIKKLLHSLAAKLVTGDCSPLAALKLEIEAYFAGTLRSFKTPLQLLGSSFQQQVWHELLRIPFGTTRSYMEQASAIGKPTAFRAVANANGANQLAIIVPCHRIINSNGKLGGYGGGLERKKWLLAHESKTHAH